jgi:hypothetical protein
MNKISSSLAVGRVRKLSLTTTWALFNQQFRALETPRRATRHCVMYVSKKRRSGRIFSPFFPPLALSLLLLPRKRKKKAARAWERKERSWYCARRAVSSFLLCGFFHFFTSLIKLLLHASFVPSPRSSSGSSSRMLCQRAGEFYFAASTADATTRSQRQCWFLII